jgi:hypothetical protein
MKTQKLFTAVDGAKSFETVHENWRKHVVALEDKRPLYERAARLVRPFSRMMPVRLEMSPFQMTINLYVESMDAAAPVLEELAEGLGIEFDKSKDTAEEWFTYRAFESGAAPWLKVDANLTGDGPECSRVQVGEKLVPVYEIRCGEDAQQAAPDQAPM